MNKIKLYELLKEAYDELEYLVEPVVREDIRDQRGKLLEAINILKDSEVEE